ncbi:site-specific DNA-methyltransferase [Myroides odoratus]|uniref:site-specific DNA-methyltransferase n=1 Tax=Myroides odoratus TaxID=256 RepID=UPI002169BE8F|nr:site-specific DNA-methyltransferase [Myroides odoratus]MCS4238291.1 adenine-specific DNA-methyltransferase [Myroides odoratus]
MNQKREQVMDFIDRNLPKDIKDILAQTQSKDSAMIQAELDQMGKSLDDAGVARESAPKYVALKAQLENAVDTNALEQEVFSHLASFFKRYYKDGDFVSLRRYKKDVYAIPYEGEEVKLHWANADQYYIKTSEYLKNYAFKLSDGKKVHFQLKEASTEQNNNKTQGDTERRFSIFAEQPIEVVNGELFINFTYEPHKKSVKQDELAKNALEVIQSNIVSLSTVEDFSGIFDKAPTEKNKNRTLVEKHLNNFISRNSFDYFIHKDLGGFLSRELDFYIKNEVLYIDDINTENPAYFTAQLSKIKALKLVASKIINFLAQIENFQKKLWLKKKFVISTNYCITLDRIRTEYYPEIASNEAQLTEWKELFGIVIPSTEAEALEALRNEPFLVVDTKFFSEEFKDKILAEFDNLDEETNGLLINSENFQALNVLQEKYQEKVKTIYIDPPYNTGDDGFIYKDDLSHSSWLSFMSDRILYSNKLLNENGSFFCQINDKEYNNLSLISNQIFGVENRVQSITVKTATPAGFKVVNPGPVDVSESILFYTKNKSSFEFTKVFIESNYVKDYKYYVSNIDDNILNWKISNIKDIVIENLGFENEKALKAKYGNDIAKRVLEISISEFALKNSSSVFATYGPHKPTGRLQELIELSKKSKDKLVYEERDGFSPYILLNGRLLAFYSNKLKLIDKKEVPTELLTDIWTDISWDSLSSEGKVEFKNGKKPEKLLRRIFEINNLKKNDTVLDFFGGSGTTSAASIKSGYKNILVELGEYFNERTLKRIKHVINGEQGGISKLNDWKGGGFIKYQVLESYEDALNNLAITSKAQDGLIQFSEEAQEEYLLNYMLNVETQDHLFNIQMFRNPFNYQLKVTENNELVPTKVDLVETFNYLIGLYVERMQRVGDIKFVEGKTREGVKTLIIWRNLETTTNEETAQRFRKIYDSVRSSEFDQIYINGDHHFDNMRTGEDNFKVKLIEETFFMQMFNVSEL